MENGNRTTHKRPTTGAQTMSRAAIIVLLGFFMRHKYMLLTSAVCTVGRVVYPSWGSIPRSFQYVVAVLHLAR